MRRETLAAAFIPPTLVLGLKGGASAGQRIQSVAEEAKASALNGAKGPTSISIPVEIASGKFDYMCGRVASNSHNVARSNQLALEMKRLGVPDTPAGREILTNHFTEVARTEGNISRAFSNQYGNFEVRDSMFIGPSGKAVKFERTFHILENGIRRFSTAIPLRGGN